MWYSTKKSAYFRELLPLFVPERFREAMQDMGVTQMLAYIYVKTHWKVKEITNVYNRHLEEHHRLFLHQHGIQISHPFTFHGAKRADIEAICEWGFTHVLQRRALHGCGELYVGLQLAMARAYGIGLNPQVLVLQLASGGRELGWEGRKDYGQDANGVPNLTLTNPEGDIFVVKSRDMLKIENNVTFEWGGNDGLTVEHLVPGMWFTDEVKVSIYTWLVGNPEATPELLRAFAPRVTAGTALLRGLLGVGSAAAAGSAPAAAGSAVLPGPGLGRGRGRGSAPAAAGSSKVGFVTTAKTDYSLDPTKYTKAVRYAAAQSERKLDIPLDVAPTGKIPNGEAELLRVGDDVEIEGTYGDFEKATGHRGRVTGIYSGTRTVVLVRLYDSVKTAYVWKQNQKKNRFLKPGPIKQGGFPYVTTENETQGYALLAGLPSFFRPCKDTQKSDDTKAKNGKRLREPDDGAKGKKGKSPA